MATITAKKSKATQCRHCRERPANRRRGFCWRCYRDPAVRRRYEAPSEGGPPAVPVSPCPAPPRSAERMREYERRAALGLALHHKDDGPRVRVDLN